MSLRLHLLIQHLFKKCFSPTERGNGLKSAGKISGCCYVRMYVLVFIISIIFILIDTVFDHPRLLT